MKLKEMNILLAICHFCAVDAATDTRTALLAVAPYLQYSLDEPTSVELEQAMRVATMPALTKSAAASKAPCECSSNAALLPKTVDQRIEIIEKTITKHFIPGWQGSSPILGLGSLAEDILAALEKTKP